MTEYYQKSVQDTLAELGVEPAVGLSESQVRERQAQYGLNELPSEGGVPWLKLLLSQFTDIMVLFLIAAAVISAVIGDVKDTMIILAIVVLNAALGFYQEYQAEQALAALSAMQVPHVRTRRGGHVHLVSATELVPGDIVLIECAALLHRRLSAAEVLDVRRCADRADQSRAAAIEERGETRSGSDADPDERDIRRSHG